MQLHAGDGTSSHSGDCEHGLVAGSVEEHDNRGSELKQKGDAWLSCRHSGADDVRPSAHTTCAAFTPQTCNSLQRSVCSDDTRDESMPGYPRDLTPQSDSSSKSGSTSPNAPLTASNLEKLRIECYALPTPEYLKLYSPGTRKRPAVDELSQPSCRRRSPGIATGPSFSRNRGQRCVRNIHPQLHRNSTKGRPWRRYPDTGNDAMGKQRHRTLWGSSVQRKTITAAPTWRSPYDGIRLQVESSPISQSSLAAEVEGIYAFLEMVEAKCIKIDSQKAANPNDPLGPEQWQALIALHRTLLYEHHDYLMATQRPSASTALRRLVIKNHMLTRMRKHGIHALLEVLRHRRPDSQEYMLAFIYLAYQMMELLFVTVPIFSDVWIECLGDLARYRMAIEEDKGIHAT